MQENSGDSDILNQLLLGSALTAVVSPELELNQLLEQAPTRPTGPPHASLHAIPTASVPSSSTLLPGLLSVISQIKRELEGMLTKLLTLNPSRRDSVVRHLERLAQTQGSNLHSQQDPIETTERLKAWIHSHRTPVQTQALDTYFEEIALVTIGQALLLKAWSDRGIHRFQSQDLDKMNWVLFNTLKPLIPLDREGWNITRANLYSWYIPGADIQSDLWNTLSQVTISDEGPTFLSGLMKLARRKFAAGADLQSYDERFAQVAWNLFSKKPATPGSGPQTPLRKRFAFTPSLRDGTLTRVSDGDVAWLAFESNPFRMIAAELAQLWWGPSAPPLWCLGSGLEAYPRDQLQLQMLSPKPTLVQRIAEVESCEWAMVLEEKVYRFSGRSAEVQAARTLVDSTPWLKKLKSTQTSLGSLQAAVALAKLRPGGLLWWAREEPLSEAEGTPLLHHLLDQACLVAEWRLDQIRHQLPGGGIPFPKFVYLFEREPSLEKRSGHRPLRVFAEGNLKSHIEVQTFLHDCLAEVAHPTAAALTPERTTSKTSAWTFTQVQSPHPQSDWAQHWPQVEDFQALRELQDLQSQSEPLGNIAHIKAAPSGNTDWSIPEALHGFWVKLGASGRTLEARPFPRQSSQEDSRGGFFVFLDRESATAPLMRYLASPSPQRWLEQHCERKSNRWSLKEQDLKLIPVPKALLSVLHEDPAGGPALPLPGEWERLIAQAEKEPRALIQKLKDLNDDQLRWMLFARIARQLEHFQQSQAKLLSMVGSDGQVHWRSVLEVLPLSERVPLAQHPDLNLMGNLPPHLPVQKVTEVKTPVRGIMLVTEAGLNLQISSERPQLLEWIKAQTLGLKNHTWSEILPYVIVPRSVELFESLANDILQSHGQASRTLKLLAEALSTCQKN